MSFCIACVVSAVTGGGILGLGKLVEWRAERARRRAFAELDRTTPCRGRGARCDADLGAETGLADVAAQARLKRRPARSAR